MQHECNQRVHRDNHFWSVCPQDLAPPVSQLLESGHSTFPNTTGEALSRQNKKALKMSFN